MASNDEKPGLPAYLKVETLLTHGIGIAAGLGAFSGLYPILFKSLGGGGESSMSIGMYCLFMMVYAAFPILVYAIIFRLQASFIREKKVKRGYLLSVLIYLLFSATLLALKLTNAQFLIAELIFIALLAIVAGIAGIKIVSKEGRADFVKLLWRPKSMLYFLLLMLAFFAMGAILYNSNGRLETSQLKSFQNDTLYIQFQNSILRSHGLRTNSDGRCSKHCIFADSLHKGAVDNLTQLYALNDNLNSLNDNLANVSERYYLKSKINFDVEAANDTSKIYAKLLDSLALNYITQNRRYDARCHLMLLNLPVLYGGLGRDAGSKRDSFMQHYNALYDRDSIYRENDSTCFNVTLTSNDTARFYHDIHDDTTVGYLFPDKYDTALFHWQPLCSQYLSPALFNNTDSEFIAVDKYLFNVITYEGILLAKDPTAITLDTLAFIGDTDTSWTHIKKKYHLTDNHKINEIRKANSLKRGRFDINSPVYGKYLVAKINYTNSFMIHNWVKTYIRYRLFKVQEESDQIYGRTSWLFSESQYKMLWVFYFMFLIMGVTFVCLYLKINKVEAELDESNEGTDEQKNTLNDLKEKIVQANEYAEIKRNEFHLKETENEIAVARENKSNRLDNYRNLQGTVASFMILIALLMLPLTKDISKLKITADHPFWMATLPTWSIPDYLSQAYKNPLDKDQNVNGNQNNSNNEPPPPAIDTSMNAQFRAIRKDEDSIAQFVIDYIRPAKKK